ncbi:MAG: DUF4446 family protein [Johnsonella sp.]|nr:DUF4446 family protein [Johnsonella sp.]
MTINQNFLLYGLIAMDLILLFLIIISFIRYQKLFRSFDYFMRGKTAENLEDFIRNIGEDIKDIRSEDRANKEAIRLLNKNQRASYQKFGVVKYNAFKGMGGNLSFVCALLDYTNSGFILNSVHSREGCYVYIKTVDRGQTEVLLGSEEKEALEQALGYKERTPG